jgi:hypothetical protein
MLGCKGIEKLLIFSGIAGIEKLFDSMIGNLLLLVGGIIV